jgi:hypothetical protein
MSDNKKIDKALKELGWKDTPQNRESVKKGLQDWGIEVKDEKGKGKSG